MVKLAKRWAHLNNPLVGPAILSRYLTSQLWGPARLLGIHGGTYFQSFSISLLRQNHFFDETQTNHANPKLGKKKKKGGKWDGKKKKKDEASSTSSSWIMNHESCPVQSRRRTIILFLSLSLQLFTPNKTLYARQPFSPQPTSTRFLWFVNKKLETFCWQEYPVKACNQWGPRKKSFLSSSCS